MVPPAEWDTDFPVDYAHAVGVFALSYNALEFAVFVIFRRYAPGPPEVQSHLFAALNNKSRRDFIRKVSASEDSIAASDAVDHAMRCFDVCSENRNLLMHAAPMLNAGKDSDMLTMVKAKTDKPHLLSTYEFTLEAIRSAADEIKAVEDYVFGIANYWEAFDAMTSLPDMPTLPEKPLLPRKLSLSLRPPTPEA